MRAGIEPTGLVSLSLALLYPSLSFFTCKMAELMVSKVPASPTSCETTNFPGQDPSSLQPILPLLPHLSIRKFFLLSAHLLMEHQVFFFYFNAIFILDYHFNMLLVINETLHYFLHL